ncbi:MATE family efflux transporter [Alienimonas chondri]|uniref:Multidrug-efflux transporter n=1 Tax=Alienimonas chondri TaxID=2681879 RepID=A0ABX1VGP9_9PLAN|nr:MATE family efflux transporter [Alienimonas chondri]NNJ27018.1 Multidrug resistance protein MdtK [Alienimonas chondri]
MDVPASPPPSSYPAGSLRELWAVAAPLAISTGSVGVAHVADRVFLARFDPAALAASMPAGMLQWAVLSPFLGVGMTVGTFVAQNAAAGQPSRAATAVWQGVWAAVLAALFFAALAPSAGALFDLAGHGPEVRRAEIAYFQMLCWGAFPTVASFALSGFYAGRGRTSVVMAVNLAAALANIGLDWILIFGARLPWGLGEIPAYGITGAGAATAMSFVVACGLYLLCMTRGAGREIRIYSHARFDRAMAAKLLKVGLPTGLNMAADVVALTAFLFLVGRLGRNELAATTLAFNLNSLCFLPAIGLGSAATILVGHRVGEGRPDLAVRTGWLATASGAAMMCVSGAIFILFPGPLIELYLGDGDSFTPGETAALWATAPALLKFVAAYSLFDIFAVVFGGAVRGAGDTTFPALWTIFCAWGLMVAPTAWGVLGGGHWEGRDGVFWAWACCTAYIVSGGLGMTARFIGGKWKAMSVLEEGAIDEITT